MEKYIRFTWRPTEEEKELLPDISVEDFEKMVLNAVKDCPEKPTHMEIMVGEDRTMTAITRIFKLLNDDTYKRGE